MNSNPGESENIRGRVLAGLSVGRKRSPGLRMAPMIDIIFLLLIFFLVTAKWRPEESFLPFQLPTANAAHSQFGKAEPLVINISATIGGCKVRIGGAGAIEINDANIEADLVAMMEELSNCIIEQRRLASDPIEINCGPSVKWEHLAKIYNLFFGAGLTDITFAMTEHPQNG